MRKILFSTLMFFIVICSSAQISGLSTLIKKVDPSVIKVLIINDKNEYESQGSGIIISKSGICVSNYHVFIGAKKAIVVTASGQKFDVTKIIDYSKENDLIKFKIGIGSNVLTPAVMNTILPFKGADVFAVGYPNGFSLEGESTLSTGVISGFRDENGERIIQTSTPFTHGSSGGGLFDNTGKLLGITSGTFAEDLKDRHANLNKVIPVALIKKLSRQLDLTLSSFYQSIQNDENFILAMQAYDTFNFETAADYFLLHIQDYPEDAVAWMRLGNSFNQMGRSQKDMELLNMAIDCFDNSLSLDTSNYYAWGQEALVYSIIGELRLAKIHAYRAYELDPKVAFNNYVIGKVANEAKDYSLAIEFLTYAIDLANTQDKANLVHQWYLERAIANAWIGRDYDAESDYKQCLNLNGSNLDCLFWYGNFLGLRNRKSEMCTQFKRLKQLSPYYKMEGYTIDELIEYYKCY
jgi:tetratricopeptide (TPR) repeat protein